MRTRQRMVKYSQIKGIPRVALVQMHDSGILRRERIKEVIIHLTVSRMLIVPIDKMKGLTQDSDIQWFSIGRGVCTYHEVHR